MQMQFALQQVSLYQQEVFATGRDLQKMKAEHTVMQSALRRMKTKGAPDAKSDAPTQEEMFVLVNQLYQIVARLGNMEVSQGLQSDLAKIQRQLDACVSKLAGLAGAGKLSTVLLDLSDQAVTVELLSGFDAAVAALPSSASELAIWAALRVPSGSGSKP